jgi:hypothetical protein
MRDQSRSRRRPPPVGREQEHATPVVGSSWAQEPREPGTPLDPAVRATMEQHLGHDFSRVRIHTDSDAATNTDMMRSQAYTTGSSILFGAGRYQPDTREGERLIAHELVHVVQQDAGSSPQISRPSDPWEQQAESIARRVVAGDTPQPLSVRPGAPALQARPLPGAAGVSLAQLSTRSGESSGAGAGSQEIVTASEVVPKGETPGSFEGFQTIFEALVYANRQERVTAIVRDKKRRADEPEHFHVLVTHHAPFASGGEGSSVIPYVHEDFQVVRWMHLTRPGESWQDKVASLLAPAGAAGGWSGKVKTAHNLLQQYRLRKSDDARSAAEQAFVPLIVQAFGVRPGEVRIVRKDSDAHPDAINFDLEESAHATTSGGIQRDETTNALSANPPAITLGPGAFHEQSPVITQMTLVHEAAHFAHATRANELLGVYARSGGTRTFEEWLKAELKAGRITQVDYELASEDVRGANSVTESLSYVEGFVSGYHLLSPDLDPLLLFDELIKMESEFLAVVRSPGYSVTAANEVAGQIVERLSAYYRAVLDSDHRQRFDRYMSSRLAVVTDETLRALYQPLASLSPTVSGGEGASP